MKTTPFGQRIAHGTMVFSIGVGLTASVDQSRRLLLRLRPAALHQAGIHRRHDPARARPSPPRRTIRSGRTRAASSSASRSSTSATRSCWRPTTSTSSSGAAGSLERPTRKIVASWEHSKARSLSSRRPHKASATRPHWLSPRLAPSSMPPTSTKRLLAEIGKSLASRPASSMCSSESAVRAAVAEIGRGRCPVQLRRLRPCRHDPRDEGRGSRLRLRPQRPVDDPHHPRRAARHAGARRRRDHQHGLGGRRDEGCAEPLRLWR